MEQLQIDAAAKINWRLAVIGRRADGYHLLMGLMQSISLSDTVYLSCSDVDSCRITPLLPVEQHNNLAFKAWQLLKRHLRLSQCLEIVIEKRIPAGSGLGGGSADAAAVLKGANALLDLGLGLDELSALGRSLGADVPFCLLGGLAKAEGVGDILTPLIASPPLHILLVNPGFTVPTAQVFNHYRENGKPFANAIEEEKLCRQLSQALAHGDVAAINSFLANALSSSAQQLYPPIRLLEQRMRAVGLNPLLSGSGGTLFALLESEIALRQAQRELKDLPWLTGAITIN